MKAEKQTIFYNVISDKLTELKLENKMSSYDIAKFANEQWTTIDKMVSGGKFMAHHFLWIKNLGVDLNALIDSISVKMDELPEGEANGSKEVSKKRKSKRPNQYVNLVEEPEIEDSEEESIDDLF